jgi:hypothetical protein
MNGGDDGRAAARGEALRRWQNRGAEVQKGLREEEKREKFRRTNLKFLESSRASR